jgi:hypothetical protein
LAGAPSGRLIDEPGDFSMTISRAALAATLALGAAAPASAQAVFTRPATNESQVRAENQAQQPQPPAPERQYNLSRAERTALNPVLQAVQAANTPAAQAGPAEARAASWAAAQAALPAAQAAAQGADAKYVVGQLQVQIGLATQNVQMQAAGVDAMLASGAAPAEQMLALYNNQARFAADAGDVAKADRALDQVIALSTNDPLAIARDRGAGSRRASGFGGGAAARAGDGLSRPFAGDAGAVARLSRHGADPQGMA